MQSTTMIETVIDWDEDVKTAPEEEYKALVRALNWTERFGLFFVRSSPAMGEKLINQVRQDVSQKTIEVLRLEQPIDNFYNIIDSLPNKDQINILFITGIEKSFIEYIKPGYGGQGDYYKLDSVPRVLGHLNLQRERFRDNFNICFVFILPLFALKYFIRRAPDFFDWRSGVFEFSMDTDLLQQESIRAYSERWDTEDYLTLKPQERKEKIIEIQSLIDEDQQTPEQKAELFVEQGLLHYTNEEYEEAITSFDQALKFKLDLHEVWKNRGNALGNLGRLEEAIASFDQALKFKPDDHEVWKNRGNALGNLGRLEEAIASFDQALKFKLDLHEAWNNRGIALDDLGRLEEAIASYDQALNFKPDLHEAWKNDKI